MSSSSSSPVQATRTILTDSDSSSSQNSTLPTPPPVQKRKHRHGDRRGSAIGVPGRRASTLLPEPVDTYNTSSSLSELSSMPSSSEMLMPTSYSDDTDIQEGSEHGASSTLSTSDIDVTTVATNEVPENIRLISLKAMSPLSGISSISSDEVANNAKKEPENANQ